MKSPKNQPFHVEMDSLQIKRAMKRALPPAGHKIRLFSIFESMWGNSKGKEFLKRLSLNSPALYLSSGTAALTFALQTLKEINKKEKVVLPAYSCPSIIAAVIRAGLIPVLCDLKGNSFQLDLDQLSSKLGPETLAVIAVHLFGIPEDVIEIRRMVQGKGVFLIEDAAQAFGNRLHLESLRRGAGQSTQSAPYLGTLGDVGILSFGRGKPFTLLSGGAVLINNPHLLVQFQNCYNFLPESTQTKIGSYLLNLFLYSIFYHPQLYWIPQRIPWLKLGETIFSLTFKIEKINSLSLQLARKNISDIPMIREIRLKLTRIYIERLKGFADEFEFFPESYGSEIALNRFPVIFKRQKMANQVLRQLKRLGLGATGMYNVPLHELEGISKYLPGGEPQPHSKFIAERILTLPLHEYVLKEDADLIYQIFTEYMKNES